MDEKFIFTIVTPSFNQGMFINDTIMSVLTQKGDFFIDYIIMDGGSKDNTIDVIKDWENKITKSKSIEIYNKDFYYDNKYIKCNGISYQWISCKDNGQVDALKKGFADGVGSIYAWLNSDDIYLKDNVFEIVQNGFINNSSVKIITADGVFIDKMGQEFGKHKVDEINVKELIYLDYHILQPSTFFKKSIYNSEDLDESMVCAFDAKFFIKLFLSHKYLKVTNELSAFRIYAEIKTLSLSDKRYFESMLILNEYSKNFFYNTISRLYKYFEITKKPFIKLKSAKLMFRFLRDLSYLLVIKRLGR